MKKDKHLDPIVNQAVKASFKDGKLIESQVIKLINTFKKLSKNEAIYLISGYLKGLRREMAFHELVVESAVPLSNSEVQKIKKSLSSRLTINEERLTINEELLGGIKVRIGDTVYDYSLQQKIQQVKGAISS